MSESKFEGKHREEDDGEEEFVLPGQGEDPSVIARAAQWFGRKGKLTLLIDFAKDNWKVFEDVADAEEREIDGSGMKFEYDECHREFLSLFEEQLEEFIDEEGFTLEEFEREAQDLKAGKSLTLFDCEHEEQKKFFDALMATLDYEHFYKTMTRVAKGKLKSSKGSSNRRSKK